MTKEHFFPRWLIDYCEIGSDGISWVTKEGLDWKGVRNLNPKSAVIPLCDECNESFGRDLESPVAHIMRNLDAGRGISDLEAELLVRWLWKFEGLQWGIYRDFNTENYTRLFTLRERVTTSRAFDDVRNELVLGIALAHSNDEGRDWPMGLDMFVGESAIPMSAVFRRVALVVSLKAFADVIHPSFNIYTFGYPLDDRNKKVFSPDFTFLTARGMVRVTQEFSLMVSELHDRHGREMKREYESGKSGQLILPEKKKILLPPI